jgi:hypothetical protein
VNTDRREKLVATEAEDWQVRAELLAEGSSDDGYWPGCSLVGEEGEFGDPQPTTLTSYVWVYEW